MSAATEITVTATYVKVMSPDEEIQQTELKVPASHFALVLKKQQFLNLLVDNKIGFPLYKDQANSYVFTRKSKKSKRYTPLETRDDFKCLQRSLNVKSHIRLTINDHTPVDFVPTKVESNDSEYEVVADTKESKDSESSGNGGSSTSGGDSIKPTDLRDLAETLSELAGEKLVDVFSGVAKDFLSSLSSEISKSIPSKDTSASEKPNQANEEGLPLHPEACCDVCNPVANKPIRGVRYKCLVCHDFDMCGSCEKNYMENEIISEGHGHSYLHPTMKIVNPSEYRINKEVIEAIPSNNIVHPNILCDRCDQNKIIQGSRFKCIVCEDFDLCGDCYYSHIKNEETISHHSFRHPMNEMNGTPTAGKALDLFLDLDLGECTSSLASSIRSLVREGVPSFVGKLETLFADSRHYRELLDSIKVSEGQEDDHDLKLGILKSLILLNEAGKNQPEVPVESSADEDLIQINEPKETEENAKELLPEKPIGLKSNECYLIVSPIGGPQSEVYSLNLINDSSHGFAASDVSFEFFDDSSREVIYVKNSNPIGVSKSRLYNVKVDVRKFIGKKVRVTFSNDDYVMEGDFKGSYSELLVSKLTADVAGPDTETKEEQEETEPETATSELSVNLALKSNGMAQVSVFNHSDKIIDCSDLVIEVFNFLGTSICKVLVHKRHGIQPQKSSKFNIALNSAHLKHPFQLVFKNNDFRAVSDLSLKNLSSDFKIEPVTESDGHSNQENVQELTLSSEMETDESSASKSLLGSTSSMVLPSLPKESLENSQSVYMETESIDTENKDSEVESTTESETDNFSDVSGKHDKDQEMLVDISDTDDFELGSDYEVLTPTASHYN